MENAVRVLTSKGLRPTQQRIAVYQYLQTHHIHPSAETVYLAVSKEYPSFSKTTVYNTLHALAKAGLIRTLNINAEEQRFDGNEHDHGHFRCHRCQEIFDFPINEKALPSFCPDRFSLTGGDVFLYGCCPQCRSMDGQ